jgi:hypothetical protein
MDVSLQLFYNYGRLPWNHGAIAFGGRLMWHQLQHDKKWVHDKNGYYCKFCGAHIENKRLRKFCPTTNCESEYWRLFIQYDCWAYFREKVFLRDKKTCQQCNRNLEHSNFICDHIFPLFKGGKDWWQDPEMTNFQTLCEECNKIKTTNDLFKPKKAKEKAFQYISLAYIFDKPVNHQLDKFLLSEA